MKRCILDFKKEYLEGLPERIETEHELWVSTGKNEITNELENKLGEIVGRSVSVVNSGTSALLVSLLLLNIQNGDKVAISNYGYPAALNCVRFLGAEPVFVDIEIETLSMSPRDLQEKIKGTKAVIVIENNGYVGNHLNKIETICIEEGVPLLEDSCASFGQNNAGRFGEIATLSFGPTKIIGCGEGGAVISDKSEKEKINGIISKMNLRLSPILQYILLKQLEDFDQIVKNRKEIRSLYDIDLFPGSGGGYMSKNPVMLSNMLDRAAIEYLHQYYPYQEETPKSRYAFQHFFDLPLHNKLKREDIKKISTIVRISEK